MATIVNGTAVGVIADVARKLGALLIYYSTDYVFDGTKAEPYTEDDRPRPINAYGRSKLAGDRAIEHCGGNTLILRTAGFMRHVDIIFCERFSNWRVHATNCKLWMTRSAPRHGRATLPTRPYPSWGGHGASGKPETSVRAYSI